MNASQTPAPERPDLEAIAARLNAAPRAPWHWSVHRVPDLVGRAGEPGVYEYDTEVLDAEHYGECGCRSACELNLNLAPGAADLIAAAPTDLADLVAYVLHLEARLGREGEQR